VDLTLGSQFQGWNSELLKVQGTKIELNLGVQAYQKTAKAFLQPLKTEEDGSFIFPPYSENPMVLLAQTQERVHLKRDSGLAARVEGRSSLARIGLTVHLTAPTIHCGFSGCYHS
jgi:deoxycytidine triphosphate deaminase